MRERERGMRGRKKGTREFRERDRRDKFEEKKKLRRLTELGLSCLWGLKWSILKS